MTISQQEIHHAVITYGTDGYIDEMLAQEVADSSLQERERAAETLDLSGREMEAGERERIEWFVRQLGKDPINRVTFVGTTSLKPKSGGNSRIPARGRHSSPNKKPSY